MTDRFKNASDEMKEASKSLGGLSKWFDKFNHEIVSALTLATEAEQLRKERDELAALVIKAQENSDVLAAREAIVLAKKVTENGNA